MASLGDGRVASGSRDNTIKVWDASSGECLQTLSGHSDSISCMIVLADGRLATASRDKTIKVGKHTRNDPHRLLVKENLQVWDMSLGKCVVTLTGLGAAARCLTSVQGRLVSGSKDEALRVWDLNNKQCVASFRAHQDEVWCLDLLPWVTHYFWFGRFTGI